jgi:hypothetical protein
MPDVSGASENAFRKAFRRYFPLIFMLWILFVLYPNPLNLVMTVHRIINPDVDPGAVQLMLDDFPSDPVAVESAVLARISYRLDWELYEMPWYFPTVEEVLERGEGDCKARALVLASVLEAKNIPYQLNSSPIHVWVDYESKQENLYENPQVKFYQYNPESGERQFQIPEIGIGEVMDSWQQQLWTPMPIYRRVLLISGSLALIVARVLLRRKRASRYDTFLY